jgi:hypothetical protein
LGCTGSIEADAGRIIKITSKVLLLLMSKIYCILLDSNKIGITKLEIADVSMGIVFSKIEFLNISSGYYFFKDYCSENGISFTDYPEEKIISATNY